MDRSGAAGQAALPSEALEVLEVLEAVAAGAGVLAGLVVVAEEDLESERLSVR